MSVPCSTLARRCIRGSQMRHWGGSATMSRNMLSITLFYKIRAGLFMSTEPTQRLFRLQPVKMSVSVCVCLPVGGSRSVLRFVCSQRKALHIRQWAAWEPPSEIDQTWIVPIHRWSQIPEKTHLHTHTRVHTTTQKNEEGSLKYYMSKPQCLP